MDPNHAESYKRENPPPYTEVAGGPPPPGFTFPVQQQPQPSGYPTQPPTVYTTSPQYYTQSTNGRTVVLTGVQTTTPVVVMGGCPTCRVGVLHDSFTCAGIFCCILFFPLGIICLLAMTEKVCSNCGARY